jgi:hypothetical protein
MGHPGRRHRSPARRTDATQLHVGGLGTGKAGNLQITGGGQTETTAAKDIACRNLILTLMGRSPGLTFLDWAPIRAVYTR